MPNMNCKKLQPKRVFGLSNIIGACMAALAPYTWPASRRRRHWPSAG